MAEEVEWWEFATDDTMSDAMTGDAQFIIESALEARGSATLALSVDEALIPLYTRLASLSVKWKYVTILPVWDLVTSMEDERIRVRRLAEIFLPKKARVLPLAPVNDDYKLAGSAASARLEDGAWPADLVIMHRNENGEIGGFRESIDLEDALDPENKANAIGLMPDKEDTPLVTLSAAGIGKARTIMLTLPDAFARISVESALGQGPDGAELTARLIDAVNVPLDIYVLDPETALEE